MVHAHWRHELAAADQFNTTHDYAHSTRERFEHAAAASIALAASVVTNGHSIAKVQFYQGTTLLGEDLTPPYSYTWPGVGAGSFSVSARLVYDGLYPLPPAHRASP